MRPSSEIHVSDAGTSYRIKIQQIFDWFNSVRQNQLLSANVSIISNNITVATGAQWIIDNVNYATVSTTSFTILYAETGYTRNDILVANKDNQIIRVLGLETQGISPTPPTPVDTVLVTIINVTDSTIGNTPPIIGGDYEKVVNKATNFTTVNNTLYPTVEAVKTYADNLLVGVINLRGTWDASTNLFPTTGGSGTAGVVRKGDLWYVSVPGVLAGKSVNVGDSFFAFINTPGQTFSNWNVIESNIGYVPADDSNVLHKTGDEVFLGMKSWSNTNAAFSMLLGSNSRPQSSSAAMSLDTSGNGAAAIFTNSGPGPSIRAGNTSTSTTGDVMFLSNNSNSAAALRVINANGGIGSIFTTISGIGSMYVSSGSGNALVSNVLNGATGLVFVGQDNGFNTFTINKTGDTVLNSITITTAPTTSAATYDLLTRNISTGVVEKISSSSFALDSAVVKTTGSQTVSGVKSLTERLQFATDQGFTSGGSMPFVHRSGDHIAICSTTLAGTARLDTKSITTSSPKTFTFPDASGTFALTSNLPVILTGSATLDFPNTVAGTSQDLNITVPGAALGDVVSLGVPFACVEPNSHYTAFVSAPNTVTVRFGNFDTSVARNPASGDFKIKVIK
ncbi:hypothetical protein [Flavobacterium lipolyticum]|uniref:DUF2793 domain-containing protein n=1 Tax=Flavobacterium lipolyticum TaxID=2893754 RepID=A0ABS8LWI7_9FLAO|nr:hypothetical protein [Flavobacterium sp. F-126]MCC9016918.1 hypothetical protein [Flavobacterium sp. F-126]